MANKKQYGLLIPKKNQLSAPKVGNVFGNDDDSEEEEGTDWVKKALKAENEKNKVKKQTQLNMQKALKEDPTIFQYDEVYDEMERTKEEEKSAIKVEKKPKYIHNLLKSADLRKKEQELRKDRLIQKEIEAEDAMFPDKERYVTSSYKAKLEEMKKFEQEQENQDRLEAIGDVTKQKDMSGFYRHLYRQTVEKNDADLGIVPETKKLNEENDSKVELQSDIDKDEPIPSDSESEENSKSENENKKEISNSSISKMRKKRQYRKRAQEVSESESEQEPEKEKNELIEKEKPEETEDKGTTEIPSKKQKLSDKIENEKSEDSNKPVINETKIESNENTEKSVDDTASNNNASESLVETPKSEEKKKINIWEKRTVGSVFEAALQRYLIRKQERLAGS